MTLTKTPPIKTAKVDLGYAYLMTGIALGCIWVSYILGALFSPDLVTGAQHQHFNSAAGIGWILNAIATGTVMPTALLGIRAKVTEKPPWTMLGLGVGTIWVAVTFVAVFAPVWVTGTDPDRIPFWAGMAAIAGVILTGILGKFVKAASFEPVVSMAGRTTARPTVEPEPDAEDPTVTVRRLAQLRDSGAITEAEFQAKKAELLNRI